MKCSSEMLQNLLYFMYKKTHVVFFVFHFMQLYILPNECTQLQDWPKNAFNNFRGCVDIKDLY